MILVEVTVLLGSLLLFGLAAFSLTAGQSVVLFANRVPRSRFFLSVLANVLTLAFTAVGRFLFLTLFLWFVLDTDWTILSLLTLILLSHAPYLLGILVFLPYLGNPILRLLRLGENLILFMGLWGFGLPPFITAVLVLGMGVAAELWRYVPFIDPDLILDRIWVVVTGRPAPEDPAVLVDYLVQTGHFPDTATADNPFGNDKDTDSEGEP